MTAHDGDFRFTSKPNTPERLREMDEWMARQFQAAIDKLICCLRESAEEAKAFGEGIRLIDEAFEEES